MTTRATRRGPRRRPCEAERAQPWAARIESLTRKLDRQRCATELQQLEASRRESALAAECARLRTELIAQPPPPVPPSSSAPCLSSKYRTPEGNLRELERLGLSPEAGAPGEGTLPPPLCLGLARSEYRERTNWLGRTERWFTADAVARHCEVGDLWLVVRGTVYDASEWVGLHPGGAAAILKRGGRDATVDFDFHSSSARATWAGLPVVGFLDGARKWWDWR